MPKKKIVKEIKEKVQLDNCEIKVTNDMVKTEDKPIESTSWEPYGVSKVLTDPQIGYPIVPDNGQHIMVHEDRVIYNILGDSVLDIGCGKGRWGYLIRQAKPKAYIVGVEVYKPYYEHTIKTYSYDNVLNQSFMDLSNIPNKSFDTVIAIEVIEHVSKDESLKLLKEFERIAKKKIILNTPSGFYELEPPLESEQHKCGWTKQELEELGYIVLPTRFKWDGCVSDKDGNPKYIEVDRDWLFCFKEV